MYLSYDVKMDDARFWDLSPNLRMYADRRLIKGNEKLPRVRWFERIVNHCLRNFVDDKTENISVEA